MLVVFSAHRDRWDLAYCDLRCFFIKLQKGLKWLSTVQLLF